jgi:hypothetical protein
MSQPVPHRAQLAQGLRGCLAPEPRKTLEKPTLFAFRDSHGQLGICHRWASEAATPTPAWTRSDRLGSVRDLTGGSGDPAKSAVYDSFGNFTTERAQATWAAMRGPAGPICKVRCEFRDSWTREFRNERPWPPLTAVGFSPTQDRDRGWNRAIAAFPMRSMFDLTPLQMNRWVNSRMISDSPGIVYSPESGNCETTLENKDLRKSLHLKAPPPPAKRCQGVAGSEVVGVSSVKQAS